MEFDGGSHCKRATFILIGDNVTMVRNMKGLGNKMNGRYLFLLAWVDSSDGACSEETHIYESDDLYPQYTQGNDHIFAVEIWAPSDKIAWALGYQEAFFDNFTAQDTVSDLVEIGQDEELPFEVKSIAL